jgi:hypothetical protein
VSRRVDRSERGSATLEAAVLFPATLLVVLLACEAFLYWHARDAALSAAQQGLSVAKVHGASAGAARAAQVAVDLGGIDEPAASAAGTAQLSVVVTGAAPSVLPGFAFRLREGAAGPAESYRAP